MSEKAQFNLRLDPEQKEDWEQYVEESRRFGSLSDLIRSSVEAEINQEHQHSVPESPGLTSDVQALKTDLERIRKDVTWLREQEQDAADISDIAQEVYDSLEPLPRPGSQLEIPEEVDDSQSYRRQQAAHMVIQPSSEDDATREGTNSQTSAALAERVNSTVRQVEDAIEHLQDQFMPVVSVEIEGHTHYFKEE